MCEICILYIHNNNAVVAYCMEISMYMYNITGAAIIIAK